MPAPAPVPLVCVRCCWAVLLSTRCTRPVQCAAWRADLRVVLCRAGGGSPNRLLSGAADRFNAMRHRMAGEAPAAAAAPAGADSFLSSAWQLEGAVASEPPASPSEDTSHEQQQQLGQKLRSGFRGLLGKGSSKGTPPTAVSDPAAGKKGWGDKMRHRLAAIGGSPDARPQQGAGEAQQGTGEAGPQGAGAGAGGRAAPAHAGLGTVAEEGAAAAAAAAQHGGTAGASGSGGAAGAGQAVKLRLNSGLQAVGRGLTLVKGKLSDRQAVDEVAARDQDVAIRVGLAAFAVAGVWACVCNAPPPKHCAVTAKCRLPAS